MVVINIGICTRNYGEGLSTNYGQFCSLIGYKIPYLEADRFTPEMSQFDVL